MYARRLLVSLPIIYNYIEPNCCDGDQNYFEKQFEFLKDGSKNLFRKYNPKQTYCKSNIVYLEMAVLKTFYQI